ncbi:MAG: PilN domain-containing protein [Hyphomicrobium sp.]
MPTSDASLESAAQTPHRGFFSWWAQELRGLVPVMRRDGHVAPKRRLIAAFGSDSVRWFEETDQSLTAVGPDTAMTDLDSVRLTLTPPVSRHLNTLPLGIRLDTSACYERRVELPEGARNDFARILSLELERVTPFRLKDVYTAYCDDRSKTPPKGKAALRQFIVKRELLDDPLESLRGQGLIVSFADCWDDTGSKPVPINFLAKSDAPQSAYSPAKSVAKLLCLACVCLGIAAFALAIFRYQAALQTLDAEIAAAKTRTLALRQTLNRADDVFKNAAALIDLRKRYGSTVEILDALSRLLPDTTYLTDLRLENGKMTLSGFTQSAANLVPAIEGSTYFEAAAMSAPVLFDASRNLEQFQIEAKLPGAPPDAAATQERAP